MAKVASPGTLYRHLDRLRQIVMVFAKYGFGDFLDRLRIWEHINIERRLLHQQGQPPSTLTAAKRLRLALEELGPTFVKLGQMLSTRPDLLPPDFIRELQELQRRVAPEATEVVRGMIESELGCSLTEVFSSFDENPVGAASLAQVHRAMLTNDQMVAVKVLRPEAEGVVRVDLEIMAKLAALLERYLDEARQVDIVGLVGEFSSTINKELDLRVEAANMRRFADNFAEAKGIHVPTVFPELCTKRILVMEYIEGIEISDVESLRAQGYDLSLIARRGAEISLRATLEHGFFHADPHPGNVLVLSGNVVCLLDYGMMGRVSLRQRERLARLAYCIVSQDERMMARALLALAGSNETVDVEQLAADLSDIVQEYRYLQPDVGRLGTILYDLRRLVTDYNLRFPTQLVWLLKALAIAEDTSHRLDPNLEILDYARPYAERLLRRQLSPLQRARGLYFGVIDALELVEDLPYDIRDILRQLKAGHIRIEFEHAGLEPIRRTLNRASNRIAMAIILAALLTGSSLIARAELAPRVGDMPVIALVGYIVAALLGLWLIVSAIRMIDN